MKDYQCDNCRVFYSENAIAKAKHQWPNIPGLEERCEPGGIIPAAECRICGSLVYKVDKPAKPKRRTRSTGALKGSPYSVIVDLGDTFDHQTYMTTVKVLPEVLSHERTKDAARQAREEAAEEFDISLEEAVNIFKIIVIMEGDIVDVQTGEE